MLLVRFGFGVITLATLLRLISNYLIVHHVSHICFISEQWTVCYVDNFQWTIKGKILSLRFALFGHLRNVLRKLLAGKFVEHMQLFFY